MNFTVVLSSTSKKDIADIYHYIAYELKEPSTANKYIKGIYQSIIGNIILVRRVMASSLVR
jgi:plasmid stabilization system protein ParE